MRFAIIAILLASFGAPASGFAQPGPDQSKPDESAESSTPAVEKPAAKNPNNPFVAEKLATTPRDAHFGRQPAATQERALVSDSHVSDTQVSDTHVSDNELGPVDRRRDLSALADRNILAPMALTPAKGTITYSNYNILGNYVTYGASDKLAVTGGMIVPLRDDDLITSVSAKYKLYESRDWLVSALPFGVYSNGTMEVDTYQFGLGGGLLADFDASDRLVLTGGVLGFATLAAGYQSYEDGCTPGDAPFRDCNVESTSLTLPSGGHWVAATVGATWHLTDRFAFNVESIVGGSWGTFFGVEDNIAQNDFASRRDRFENPQFVSGLPYGDGPTLSAGASWANGKAGLQMAVLFMSGKDNADTVVVDESTQLKVAPMLSGAYNF